MAENSKIEWCDCTFNPWRGCSKVSPACKNCYAMEQVNRYGGDFLGRRVVAAESTWKQPLKWNHYVLAVCDACGHDRLCEPQPNSVDPMEIRYDFKCSICGSKSHYLRRQRVFCASWADVFEDWDGVLHTNDGQQLYRSWHHAQPEFVASALPCEGDSLTLDDVRSRLFRLIDATPNLDWLLLTKRPENIQRMWFDPDTLNGFPKRKNVWLGTTVENQEQADKRIPELLKCRDLSPVLFLSCEPLLGPVDLSSVGGNANRHPYTKILESQQINWLICGGESGREARPMHPDWARSIRDQCRAAEVPFFFKQWGEWQPQRRARHADLSCDSTKQLIVGVDGQITTGFLDVGTEAFIMDRVGKKRAGRLLDGKEFNEFPSTEASKHESA